MYINQSYSDSGRQVYHVGYVIPCGMAGGREIDVACLDCQTGYYAMQTKGGERREPGKRRESYEAT